MSSILDEIAEYKRDWVAECKQEVSEARMLRIAKKTEASGFCSCIVV